MSYRALMLTLLTAGCGGSETEKIVEVPGACDSSTATTDATTSDTTATADTSPTTDGPTPETPAMDTGPGCPIKDGGDMCATIPKFTGTQNVDGIGDEFCDVPSTVLRVNGGVPLYPTFMPAPLSTKVRARLAWSATGLHGHFHVDDSVVVSSSYDNNWDGVHLFLGGELPFYGAFDGDKSDTGLWLFMAPPGPKAGLPRFTGGTGAFAQVGYCILESGVMPGTGAKCNPRRFPLVEPGKFAGRIVEGGYELEVMLPWSVLGRASAPSKGDSIAADLGLAACDDPAATAWSNVCSDAKRGIVVLQRNDIPGSTSCLSGSNPTCDARTWCRPTLE
jgi:hypothetical protein